MSAVNVIRLDHDIKFQWWFHNLRLKDLIEGEAAEEADDGDDGLDDGPGAEGLGDGEAEVFFDEPEAAVVDVGGDEGARAHDDDEEFDVHRLMSNDRRDDSGGGGDRDCGGTGGDANQRGNTPT